MAGETETVRTHVILPRRIVEEIDRLVGERKRSEYIAKVLDDRLHAERQREALDKYAGALNPADYPHWATPEKTSEWVRQLRRETNESWQRKMQRMEE